MGSIESDFQFESYKIDKVELNMQHTFGLLELKGNIDESLWELKISIRDPLFSHSQKKYVGGLDAGLYLILPEESRKEGQEDTLLKIEIGIVGIFKVKDDRFNKEIEEQLVKHSIPAILFPYVRAAMTSLLSNAGFGSVVLPLINIQKLAKDTLRSVDIKLID